jgi:hypothetical protein
VHLLGVVVPFASTYARFDGLLRVVGILFKAGDFA